MSLFDTLDQAVTGAASNAASVISAPLSGAQIRINTNVLPSFKLGGLFSSSTGTTPGLAADLGLQYSIDLLDANGGVITSIGNKPAFSPLVAGAWIAGLVVSVYLLRAALRAA